MRRVPELDFRPDDLLDRAEHLEGVLRELASERRDGAAQARNRRGGGPGVIDGFLVIDKPEGLTSHDVVQRVRRIANQRRVGHLGTLDPLATGVLPIALRRRDQARRSSLTHGAKCYRGKVLLGVETDDLRPRGRGRRRAPTARWPTPRRAREGAVGVRRRDRAGAAAVLRGEAGRPGRLPARAPRRRGEARAAPRLDQPHRAHLLRAAATSRSRSTAAPAPTCARWPTIWARRSAAARTSTSCAAPAAGRSSSSQAITLDALEALGARGADRVIPMLAATGLPTFEIDARVARRVRNGVQLGRQEIKGAPGRRRAAARARGASGGTGRGGQGHS